MKQNIQSLGITLILIALIGYFIKYGMNIVLAHHMSAHLFGNFSILSKFIALSAMLLLLGTNVSANRFLSKYLMATDKNKQYNYIQWNLNLLKRSTLYYSLLLITVTAFFALYPPHTWHPSLHILWATPFAALTILLSNYLQANQDILTANIISQSGRNIFIMIFTLLIVDAFEKEINTQALTFIIMISFIALALLLIFLVKNRIFTPHHLNYKKLLLNKAKHTNPKWFRISFKMILPNILFVAISLIDLVIIKFIHYNPHDLGHYAAIITIGSLIIIGSQVIYNSFKSKISTLITEENKKAKLQIMIKHSNRINLIYSLIVTVLIIIFNQKLLAHFGPSYLSASTALIIITLTYLITSLAKVGRILLTFGRYEKILFKITLLELILLISLAIPLTHFYGIEGIAFATLVSACFRLVSTYYFTYIKLKLKPLAIL